MPVLSFRTVGFDLDGTLLDTSGDLAAAVNHALAGMGRAPLPVDQIRPMIGGGGRHMLAQALVATGGYDPATLEPAYQRLIAFYADHIAVATRPYPGLEDALDKLAARGVSLAVVTNKQERLARAVLAELGLLDRFATVIGGDTLGPGRGKPAPDLIHLMLERCGGPAVFVGDSRYDMEAARAAGVPTVLCTFGYRQEPVETLDADAVIDAYAELLPALERLA
jgi:phosphoglycolate phosphatase